MVAVDVPIVPSAIVEYIDLIRGTFHREAASVKSQHVNAGQSRGSRHKANSHTESFALPEEGMEVRSGKVPSRDMQGGRTSS